MTKNDGPMDPGSIMDDERSSSVIPPRATYAIETLVEEVTALFPETTHELGDYDWCNAAHDVIFDTHESPGLDALLTLVIADDRVVEVTVDSQEQRTCVSIVHDATVQDGREPFDLAAAWSLLCEGEGFFGGDSL